MTVSRDGTATYTITEAGATQPTFNTVTGNGTASPTLIGQFFSDLDAVTPTYQPRQAMLNIRSAQAQVAAAQTGVAQGQEALRLAYLRYQGGLGTFLDVLNALAQLARTRTNLSNAGFFYQTSLAQLVRATGGR